MRGRKMHHARKTQDKRKRSPEQQARLDAVFAKEQSCDVDPLDDMPRVYVVTDLPDN